MPALSWASLHILGDQAPGPQRSLQAMTGWREAALGLDRSDGTCRKELGQREVGSAKASGLLRPFRKGCKRGRG